MDNRILLFIPMYNCEKQIPRVLGQLNEDIIKYISEIIIVNNISTDNGENISVEYCQNHKELPVKILRNKQNYGLGGSHKVAFDYAINNGFDYLIVLHGDDQGNIQDLLPQLEMETYKNFDCLLGARFMKGSKLKGYSWFRTFGNYVYDFLFSIGAGFKIYDLGSGLNMYKVETLKNKFYFKYKDNLMFNYCMILGSAFYKHKVKFFPITWREEDQISNVKLVNQAITVLKILTLYIFNKNKFIDNEFRDNLVDNYSADIIYSNI